MNSDWVKIYEADNPLEAHRVAGYLKSQGLVVRVENDLLWSAAVEVLTSPGILPAVSVPGEQAETALQLLEEEKLPETGPWTCSNCGQENDGVFSHCWNCGHAAGNGELS